MLANERLALQVADAFQYLDENFFRAVKGDGATAAARLARFSKIMDAATADPDFSEADQLSALGSKLDAIKTVKGAIPAGVARAARARVAATLAEGQIPYVRSGIINAVLPIYDLLNEHAQAYQLDQGELAKTATPYYYKADLGELAEGLGRKDEALRVVRAGLHRGSESPRFQWARFTPPACCGWPLTMRRRSARSPQECSANSMARIASTGEPACAWCASTRPCASGIRTRRAHTMR